MTTNSLAHHTILRRSDQSTARAMGGILDSNKPVIGGSFADGSPSAALFYWSHSVFHDAFEFGLHPHRGFEILTFVIDGENQHYDSAGRTWIPLRSGDVQVIRSGSGIEHSERIIGGTRAFQIWFDPNVAAALSQAPEYHDHPASSFAAVSDRGLLRTDYVGADGPIASGVEGLEIARLRAEETVVRELAVGAGRFLAAYVIDGTAQVGASALGRDDLVIVRDEAQLDVELDAGAEVFCISLPLAPGYAPVREGR